MKAEQYSALAALQPFDYTSYNSRQQSGTFVTVFAILVMFHLLLCPRMRLSARLGDTLFLGGRDVFKRKFSASGLAKLLLQVGSQTFDY